MMRKDEETKINRITIDIDDKKIESLLKCLKTLKRYGFTKKVSIHESPSGTGFHVISWSATGVTKKKLLKIRRKAGDDKIRCDLDERSGRQINVLFTKKTKTDLRNPFHSVPGNLLNRITWDIIPDIFNDVDDVDVAMGRALVLFFVEQASSERKRKRYHELCSLAVQMNKPMYAIIKNYQKWDEFEEYPWRKTFTIDDIREVQQILRKIVQDIDLLIKSGGS